MKRMIIATTLLFGFGLATSLAADEVWEKGVDQLIAKIAEDKSIPGLSVAVVQGGEVVFSKAYGLSNVEMNLPATMDTVYPISSVSKIFAGMVAMALVEEGKLVLSESVLTYLPFLPQEYKSITIRNLLSHTHGLTDHYQSDDFNNLPEATKKAMTAKDIMLWNAPGAFKFQPGKGWDYSLLGYVMLNGVYEKVSGSPYKVLVDKYITGPLGMTSAKYGGTEVVVKGRHPVLYELVDGKLINHPMDFAPEYYPAGGQNVSVSDMAKLFQAISEKRILSPSAFEEIWTAVKFDEEKTPFYGLGWSSSRRSTGRWVVGHEGGGNAWAYYWPEEDLAVIALSNMSGARADRLAIDVVAKILEPSKE